MGSTAEHFRALPSTAEHCRALESTAEHCRALPGGQGAVKSSNLTSFSKSAPSPESAVLLGARKLKLIRAQKELLTTNKL